MLTSDRLRLPETVNPGHYDLTLALDLDQEVFTGEVMITAEVAETVDEIRLHSDALTITSLTLSATAGTEATTIAASHRLDPEAELLIVEPEAPVEPGPISLTIGFEGRFDENLVGLYLSRFTDDEGTEHKLATTQFEAPYARKCFPCFDEPAFKATFTISLIVDPDHMAVANEAEVSRQALTDGPHAGRHKVDFAPTVAMSTYLVAFVVGPLEATDPVDVDGVPIRIVHRPGQGALTGFALEAGAFALSYFRDYFDLPYPGTKLDLVAIPDFAFGAMENLGCVTFREVLLLIDPDRSTKDELQRSADVINHEIAHMWFGDLVTMKWWNGLWLNEAFATFMEMKCTDAFRPEWERWTEFGLSLSVAFRTDSLHSTRPIEYEVITPEDAEGMFDVLTYEKGAGIVRMLEQYLGESEFRDGIRHYMERHQFANAETTDLWDAIESSTGEPVRSMMDSWIYTGGHPTVSVSVDGNGVHLHQERRLPVAEPDHTSASDLAGPGPGGPGDTDDHRWVIPFRYRWSDGAETRSDRILLNDPATLEGAGADWWLGNADGSGFLRMDYPADHLERLAEVATTELSAVERYGLVDDAWAAVTTGSFSTPAFLNLLDALTAESSRPVWVRMIDGYARLGRLVDGDASDRLQEIVHDAVAPTLAGLGLAPIEGESDDDRQLRGDLIRAMGIHAKDPEIIEEAKRTVSVGLREPDLVESSILSAAVAVAARTGDEADFNDFLAARKQAPTPQAEQRYLHALSDFQDPALIERLYTMVLDGDIRTQNAPFVLARSLMNRSAGRQTWRFISERWDELVDLLASSLVTRMLQGVSWLDTPEDLAAVHAFLAEHPVPSGQMTVTQLLEQQRINVSLRQREAERLSRFLAP